MPVNLWPDFVLDGSIKSPKTIIDEAGSGLKEKSTGLLWMHSQNTRIEANKVIAPYTLYAQRLSYHYPFMSVSFPLANGYPLEIVADKIGTFTATDEASLIQVLEQIFRAESTIKTIQTLIAISK